MQEPSQVPRKQQDGEEGAQGISQGVPVVLWRRLKLEERRVVGEAPKSSEVLCQVRRDPRDQGTGTPKV